MKIKVTVSISKTQSFSRIVDGISEAYDSIRDIVYSPLFSGTDEFKRQRMDNVLIDLGSMGRGQLTSSFCHVYGYERIFEEEKKA